MSQIPPTPGIALQLGGGAAYGQTQARDLRAVPKELPTVSVGEEIKLTVVRSTRAGSEVELKGVRVSAGPLPGVAAGAELTVRVTSISPQQVAFQVVSPNSAKSTPAFVTVLPLAADPNIIARPASLGVNTAPAGNVPQAGATAASLAGLSLGQTLAARVEQASSDGNVLLSVGGGMVEAEGPTDMQLGKTLIVRVVQLQPQLVLEVEQPTVVPETEAAAANLLRARLGAEMPDGEAVALLRQALSNLPSSEEQPGAAKLQALLGRLVPEAGPPDGAQFAAWVKDGGLLYESKLARAAAGDAPAALASVAEQDLKGLLLQSLRELKAAATTSPLGDARDFRSAGGAADTSAVLSRHVDHVEARQALNLLSQIRGEPYSLQIPFFAGQQWTTAYLAVQPDRRSGKEESSGKARSYEVLFLLDLDRLGQTRIDASFTERSARVIFYAERGEAVNDLRNGLPAFREVLGGLGFTETFLAVRPLNQMPADKRPRFAALASGRSPGVQLLDARA